MTADEKTAARAEVEAAVRSLNAAARVAWAAGDAISRLSGRAGRKK